MVIKTQTDSDSGENTTEWSSSERVSTDDEQNPADERVLHLLPHMFEPDASSDDENEGGDGADEETRMRWRLDLDRLSECRMLQMFYHSVVASTIFFAAVCWGTGIKAKDSNKMNKLIKKAGSVVGTRLAPLEEVVRHRMLGKIKSIMDNVSHPLHSILDGLGSCHSQRLRQPRCARERYSASFLPEAIRLYNSYVASRSVRSG